MNAVFLGIDIGTTSLKAAAFDESGNRLALYTADYTLNTDPVTGYIELDPEVYVTMCHQAIQDIEAQCGKITALSVDTIMNRSTPKRSQRETSSSVPKILFSTASMQLFSIRGTCLWAAAWITTWGW